MTCHWHHTVVILNGYYLESYIPDLDMKSLI